MKLNTAATLLSSFSYLAVSTALRTQQTFVRGELTAPGAEGIARERIGQFVASGQQFLVMDPNVDQSIALYEDPDAEPVIPEAIAWFCPPEHAPDTNRDGEYDHVVSHALVFRPSCGKWTPHGYVASWSEEDKTYDEVVVDYNDRTIHQLSEVDENISSYFGWEFSYAGETSGVVVAGSGEWKFNTTDPRLEAMAEALGADLTGENCNAKYAEVWKEANSRKATEKEPAFIVGIVLSTVGIITLLVAIVLLCSVRSQKAATAPYKPEHDEAAGQSSAV